MQLALWPVPRTVRVRVESHRRDRGLARAAASPAAQVARAREVARQIAGARGTVSIEDVREAMPGVVFGNWAGAIFRCPEFKAVGMAHADHQGSHRRRVLVWALREVTVG